MSAHALAVEASSTDHGTAAQVLRRAETCQPQDSVNSVADRFLHDRRVDALVVVDPHGAPLGLLTRGKFIFTVFRRFGWELYGRKPVSLIMNSAPLVVEWQDSLDLVLSLALARTADDVYDEVIVTGRGGDVAGIISMRELALEQSRTLAAAIIHRETAAARARELEETDRLKSKFLAHVTHELRSPVNAIIELTEVMRITTARAGASVLDEHLPLLLSCATNLRAVINNMLDLSKIEAGKMRVRIEAFQLYPVLEEVAATTRLLIGNRPVAVMLECPEELTLVSDAIKVRQIVQNLASNAAKFTEEGSVRIHANRVGPTVRIAVTDTGVGIREEDQKRLFTAFSQLEDAHTKRQEGTGLGLVISRELLQLLGGAIDLVSSPGAGSTFTMKLDDRGDSR